MSDQITNPELAVLGLIAEKPKHGYQVELDIEQRGFREWTEIGFSSIYHILNKLERGGLLLSQRQSSNDRPVRKVYHLTASGRRAYASAVLLRLQKPAPRSSDFDLALANLPAIPHAEALEALSACIVRLSLAVEMVSAKQIADRGQGELPFHVTALFDHSLAQMQCELEWLKNFYERLSQQEND